MPCEKTQAQKQGFEDKVITAVIELLNRKGMIPHIAERLVAHNDELQSNPKLELYQKRLAETEKAIANLLRAVEQGLFSASTQERMLQLESDKADLLFRIDGEKLDIPIKLDLDETIFWLASFAKGDVSDPKFRERLADTFINKIILWNDRMLIVYNTRGTDNEKITVEQVISDYEREKEKNPEMSGFNSELIGAPVGTRTPNRGSVDLRDIHFTTGALPSTLLIIRLTGRFCKPFDKG